MKYVNLLGDNEILSIEIIFPILTSGYKYYYPDGLYIGGWRNKKVVFVGKVPFYDTSLETYYGTAKEAIEDKTNELFVSDGKIWNFGKVIFTFKTPVLSPVEMKFETKEDVLSFLENLENRWGINLNSFVCLEIKEANSLYEHKLNGFITT